MESGYTRAAGLNVPARSSSLEPEQAASQVVVFRLQGREFAFPLATVTEILRMVATTEVPESPEWLAGMINLRGQTMPVIDLRTRLGMPRNAPDLDAAIIVAEAASRGPVGFIADEVVDVLTLPAASVDSVDALAGEANPVSAVARKDGRLVVILDPGRLAGAAVDLELPQEIS